MAKLRIALVFNVLAVGALICAFAISWYRVDYVPDSPSVINPPTRLDFSFTTFTASNLESGSSQVNNYTSTVYNAPNVASTFASCLSFLIFGSAAVALLLILEIVVLCKDKWFRSKIWKFMVFIVGGAAIALLCVSFFTFLHITTAFMQDNLCALPGLISLSNTNYWCSSYLGNQHLSILIFGVGTLYWEPFAGWWMLMVAILFTIGSLVSSIFSRR